MMRKSKVLLLVPLMLLLSAVTVQAAFDNSHHDMRAFVGSTQKDSCAVCHGRRSTYAFTGATDTLFGAVGGLCLSRCHSGQTGVLLPNTNTLQPNPGPSVNTTTYAVTQSLSGDYTSVYFSNSHGRTKSLLRDRNNAQVDLTAGNAKSWPYVSASGALYIECTSCHAVHDSANAPFLWAPLAPSAAGTADSFCDRCHVERATNTLGAVNPDGNHPVDFVVDNTAASTRTGNTRHARTIVIQNYAGNRVFDVANNFAASAMTGTANSWNMGGHVTSGPNNAINNWTGAGSTQVLGCYTCHAAHRTVVNGENALTNVALGDNAATNPQYNPLCVGCHGPSTTLANDQNEWKIGTSSFGHPVGINTAATGGLYTTSVGGFSFAITTPNYATYNTNTNQQNKLGEGGRVLCTSCHKVHFGQGMSVVNINQGTKAICKQCHSGVGIPNVADASKNSGAALTGANVANSHHVTRAGSFAAGTVNKVGDATTPLTIATPSWASTTTGLGDFSTGMDCADCHTFNGTAHNW